MISDCIQGNSLHVVVKPNAKNTEVIEADAENKHVKIALKEPADKNKANMELLRFVSKQLKREVRIKSGVNSRKKILEIL